MNRQTITVPEAARESGVLVSYLYALLASGRLNGEKVDGQWVLCRSDFDSWRRQHRFYRKGQRVESSTQQNQRARAAATAA